MNGRSAPAWAEGGTQGPSLLEVFTRTCRAEWTRLWTVRATWGFLAAAALLLVGLGAVAGDDAAGGGATGPAWRAVAQFAMPAQFTLLALALTAVTADYANGGIVPTLQWTPRRSVLFAARTVVAAGAATAVGVVLAAMSGAAAYAASRSVLTLPLGDGAEVLGKVAFVFASGTLLASGLGFLLRNAAGGLACVFLLVLVLPILLPQFGLAWTDKAADVLPGSGATHLLLGDVPGMTTPSAVAALLGWAGAALLLGWQRFVRHDATR